MTSLPMLIALLGTVSVLGAVIVLMWRKNSGLKEEQERDRNIGSLFEQQPEAWVIIDGITLEAIEANQKAMNLFGIYRRPFLTELKFGKLFRDELEEEEVQLLLGAVDNGTFVNKLLQCRSLQGRIFSAVVSVSRVNEGNLFCRFAEPEEAPVVQSAPIAEQQRHLEPMADSQVAPTPVQPSAMPVPTRMVQTMTDAVAVIGLNQEFTDVNESFAALTGYSTEELRQFSFDTIVHPADGKLHAEWFQSLTGADQRVARTERRILRKDRGVVYLEILAAVLPSKQAVLITAIDNSDARREQETLLVSRANLLSLVKNTEEVIFSLDATGKMTVVNPAAKQFLNLRYGIEAETGIDFVAALPLGDRAEWKERLQEVLRGQTQNHREWVTENSEQEVYEVFIYPVRTEEDLVTGVTCFARNISLRIRQEREIAEARDKAEQATQAKSEFLAVMSHEIRTPLNGLIGITELLGTTELKEQQKEYVDIIRLSGEALLQVISDILDFSKIEANKMQLEEAPFELMAPVNDTITILSAKAHEKGLRLLSEFEGDLPQVIIGDRARVRQVLMNLVSNAVKFTDHGQISIEVRSGAKDDDGQYLVFSVRDTGIGISPEQAEKLFSAFSQADASTYRKYGGTGLGLTICKTLVELMGGKIHVEANPGGGSVFTFTIKVQEGRADAVKQEVKMARAEVPAAEMSHLYPSSILLAEDNDINRLLATRLFGRMGYTIDAAANGLEAVQMVREKKYNIVFMDVQMPELDGLEATRKIRAEVPKEMQPVIIAMTAFASPEDRQMCLDAGMDDYTPKPITLQDIEHMLHKWSVNDSTQNDNAMKSNKLVEPVNANTADPYIDKDTVARLLDIGRSDPGFLTSVLEMFLRQAPDGLRTIQESLDRGDHTAMWQAAHKLKGSCLNMGARKMAEVCKDIERKGRNLELSGLHGLSLQLESDFKVTAVKLKELFEYN